MWDQQTEISPFKTLPYYKSIVKSILQKQMHHLLEQMSEEVGEESLIMTVNLENGSLSHIGSKVGKAFLDERKDLKSQFLSFCISSNITLTKPNSDVKASTSGRIRQGGLVTWDQQTGVAALKKLPYYKSIVKSILQRQMHHLMEQMSEEVGEESFILTVNLENGSLSHIGSKVGKAFLDERKDLKSQFLSFCVSSPYSHTSRQTYGEDQRKLQDSADYEGIMGPPTKRKKISNFTAIKPSNSDASRSVYMSSRESTDMHTDGRRLSGFDSNNGSFKESDLQSKASASTDGNMTSHNDKINTNESLKDQQMSNLSKKHNIFSKEKNSESNRSNKSNKKRKHDQSGFQNFYKHLSVLGKNPWAAGRDSSDHCEGANAERNDASAGVLGAKQSKLEVMSDDESTTEDKRSVPAGCSEETGQTLPPTPKPSKPRTVLTIAEKVKILEVLEAFPNISQRKLAEVYNVGKTTIGQISRNRDQYKSLVGTYIETQRKRFNYKNCKYNNIGNMVWEWYLAAKSNGLEINGPIVQDKALQFAKDLSVTEFKASTGWLASWQSRYNVVSFSGRWSKKQAKAGKDKSAKGDSDNTSFDTENLKDENSYGQMLIENAVAEIMANMEGSLGQDLPNKNVDNIQGLPNKNVDNIQGLPNKNVDNIQGLPNENVDNIQDLPNKNVDNIQGLPNENVDNIQSLPNENVDNIQGVPNERVDNRVDTVSGEGKDCKPADDSYYLNFTEPFRPLSNDTF